MGKARILRPGPGAHENRKANFVAVYGTPVGAHAGDNEQYVVAEATNFLGFLLRDVTAAGPELADHVYPGRLDLPVKQNGNVAADYAEEIDLPDTLCASGGDTGALSGATARGTLISFTAGKARVAQAGDHAFYQLSGQVTPEAGETFRVRLTRI